MSATSWLDRVGLQIFAVNEAAVAPATVPPNGTITMNAAGYQAGRLRGNYHQDVAGVFLVEQGTSQTLFDLSWTIPQDATQPGFQYPFDIILIQPWLRITFTNGAGAAAFSRGCVKLLPI